jgi:hypothetical protein
MPHYADGTPARVGDMVQGKGYNYPEIVGTVIAVREGESCTAIQSVLQKFSFKSS